MRNRFLIVTLLLVALFALAETTQAAIRMASGKLTLLRVHDVGTKYGPASDQLDVEVVIQLNTKPGQARSGLRCVMIPTR